jgi:hypothetical protein
MAFGNGRLRSETAALAASRPIVRSLPTGLNQRDCAAWDSRFGPPHGSNLLYGLRVNYRPHCRWTDVLVPATHVAATSSYGYLPDALTQAVSCTM